MTFFQGEENYSIDIKGRVSIPAKMRKAISPEANDTFVLTRGLEDCVVAYPMDEWKKYMEKFQQLNHYNDSNRFFLRTLLRWNEEVTLDAQQRINISKKLVDFAGIDGKVRIVGLVDHIEFWNPDKYDNYLDSHSEKYEEVAAKVMSV